MSRMEHWWLDSQLLANHGIYYQYDVISDCVRFSKYFGEDKFMQRRARYCCQIDTRTLKSGQFRLLDLINQFEDAFRHDSDYRHPGPTNDELSKYPGLRNAWEEFQMIQRLTCG
jgi:hypothetical protein